ncbi:MAG: hypothetical protein QOE70_3959 [Chthoniobacter sp.]|jgi:hypothetical protein|nr:hypothetical protein [Chthoniobacter sp.]
MTSPATIEPDALRQKARSPSTERRCDFRALVRPLPRIILSAYLAVAPLSRCGAQAVSASGPEDGQRVEAAFKAMLEEPSWAAQHSLIAGFLAELPARDFPSVYAALGRFEKTQVSNYLEPLLERWAELDPVAAWTVTRPLFEIAVEGDHFIDEWAEKFIPPKDIDAFQASPFWPEPRQLLGFLAGLDRARIPETKKTDLREDFLTHFRARFPEYYLVPNPPSPPSTDTVKDEESYARVREIMEAPLAALPAMLKVAAERKNWGAVTWGLRRWIAEDPKAAPEIMRHAEWQSEEAVRAWAKVDARAALAWFRRHEPEALKDYAGRGLIAFVNKKDRSSLLHAVKKPGKYIDGGEWTELEELIAGWAREDPLTALQTALSQYGPLCYSVCADETVHSTSSPRRKALDAIRRIATPVRDQYAYMIMEHFGDIDVGEAAAYGVDWLQKSKWRVSNYFPTTREHFLREWTGNEDPEDGCMDDRTYGCLRKWAICQPEQMKKWIETQRDPGVKAALQWLLAHPNGKE